MIILYSAHILSYLRASRFLGVYLRVAVDMFLRLIYGLSTGCTRLETRLSTGYLLSIYGQNPYIYLSTTTLGSRYSRYGERG